MGWELFEAVVGVVHGGVGAGFAEDGNAILSASGKKRLDSFVVIRYEKRQYK